MRKQNAAFQTAFTSEANQGLKNTDCFGFVELDDFACYVIADGIDDVVDAMGARLAVDTVISVFTEAPSMKKSTVLRCLNAANRALLTADSKMNLKASMTVIITNYVKLMYGQAGNTRLRLYRDGFCRVQSADQSLSMDLVFGERLEPDKLTKHEERNNLYCYLGQGNDFRPFISKAIKLVNSDAVSLSTRGVWENVDEGELQDCFSEATDNPAPTVESIEDVLLTKQPAELEKYTLAVIFVNKIFIEPNKKQKIKKILAAAIPVAVVVVTAVIVIAVFLTMRAKNIEEMTQSFSDTIEYIQSDNYSRAKEECAKAQELSEKVGDKKVRIDTSNYLKLIESVIAGDEKLEGEKYEDAQNQYLNARTRSRYADNLGLSYIEERLSLTADYLSVYEAISLGDTLSQNQQPDKAEEKYLEAKATAGKIYFDKGRSDAMAALEKLYSDQKETQEQQTADTQEKAAAQTSAADALKQGDLDFAKGDYTAAKVSYTDALQKFTNMKDDAKIKLITEKIKDLEAKTKEADEQLAQAEDYVAQAQKSYTAGEYIEAKKLYLFAKDIYAGLQKDSKVEEINRRIERIDLNITEKEQQAQEEAARAQSEAAAAAQANEEKANSSEVPSGSASLSAPYG